MPNLYRPEFLSTAPWMSQHFERPPAALSAPGMLSWDERIMLSWLAAEAYRGQGEIADLGTYLGSSTVAFASGLEANRSVADKRGRIHAYDLFRGEYYSGRARSEAGVELSENGSFLEAYEANIAAWREMVNVTAGDITEQRWTGGPIEILFVDILKYEQVVDAVVREFFPHLTAGESLVIMQDYKFPSPAYNTVVMEHFADYFAYAGETQLNSVLFVNTKPIPGRMLEEFSYPALPRSLVLHYLTAALQKARTFYLKECIARQIGDLLATAG